MLSLLIKNKGIAKLCLLQVVDLLACWIGFMGSKCIADLWMMIFSFSMWYLWMERNGRCFEDKECSVRETREFFFCILSLWAKALVLNGDYSFELL